MRPGIVNVPGRTPVVINNSQLAVIFAVAKACTFRVAAAPTVHTSIDRPRYGKGVEGWENEGNCNLIPLIPASQ